MAGAQAANTLADIKIRQLERRGEQLAEADKQALVESTSRTYDAQMDPRYGAARLWVDTLLDPLETRDAITTALEVANLNSDVPPFTVGVLQV